MKISKTMNWEMGHALSHPYKGKCNQLHGHSWVVTFTYEGQPDDRGMVIDFAEFRKMKAWIEEHLDHKFLVKANHLLLTPYHHSDEEFDIEINELGIIPLDFNPTSENLAKYLHGACCQEMHLDPTKLDVTIQETCTSSATYEGREGLTLFDL